MKKIPPFFYYLAAGLFLAGYIYFFERGPVKSADSDKDKKSKIFEGYVADDIKTIKLENLATTVTAYKAPIVLEKDAKDTWQITAPQNFKANEDTVHNILSSVSNFNPEATIDNPANLADFGLNTPSARCSFSSKTGKDFMLLIGTKNITGTSSYVKTPDKNNVYMVPEYSVDSLLKSVNGYRDNTLLNMDALSVSKIRIVRNGKTTLFEKNKDGGWDITQPKKLRADEQKVKSLLNSIVNLRIADFADDHPSNAAVYGFAKPHASIEIWSSDGKESQTLLLGREKLKATEYFVKLGDQPNIYLVNDNFDKTIDINLTNYRDRSMMKFDSSQAKTLTVNHNHQTYIYQKDDKNQWVCAGRMKAQEEAVNIVSMLSNTDITDFASKKDSTGLSEPDYEIEVLLSSGAKKVYRFGNRRNGNVFLALDQDKTVYLAPAALLSQMDNYYSAIMTPVSVTSSTAK